MQLVLPDIPHAPPLVLGKGNVLTQRLPAPKREALRSMDGCGCGSLRGSFGAQGGEESVGVLVACLPCPRRTTCLAPCLACLVHWLPCTMKAARGCASVARVRDGGEPAPRAFGRSTRCVDVDSNRVMQKRALSWHKPIWWHIWRVGLQHLREADRQLRRQRRAGRRGRRRRTTMHFCTVRFCQG